MTQAAHPFSWAILIQFVYWNKTHLPGQRSDYKDGKDTNGPLIKILKPAHSPPSKRP